MNPLLSINVPTYNRARYLKILLDSIAEDVLQMDGLVEINILDNASPDNTAEIVLSQSRRLPVRYERHKENLGALQNIHFAHRAGTGRYLWIIGDDDYLLPGQLHRIVNTLKQEPAVVLLSFARRTTDHRLVGIVSPWESDINMTMDSPEFSLPAVDSMIGFLSANIIERHWVERFSPQTYKKLDEKGELAHAAMFYTAIAAKQNISYLAGAPLVQTVDNGHLSHEVWRHVCVRYCIGLPDQLSALGFHRTSTQHYFRRRLVLECIRRLLSEKYRGNPSKAVISDPMIQAELGLWWLLLRALHWVPANVVKWVHDAFYTRRS